MKINIKKIFTYLNDQSIDIRTRLMFFLEYAVLVACVIGTICMILLKQSFQSMIPNIIVFFMCFVGLYISHVKKNYDLTTIILIIGCANIALPLMYFLAGGNDSGMPFWLLLSVIITCMMSKGKVRVLMVIITIVEDLACICAGHYFPGLVQPLVGENAKFYDELQSYAVVCASLATMLVIYLMTYERQRNQLVEQGMELRKLMKTDALTGVFNRRAYYDEIGLYKSERDNDDLVIVAMDVNGLKKVNDQLGHAAGDEYMCAAARVIERALGEYGRVYRTGGDEFMAILHCSVGIAEQIEDKLNECIASQNNSWADKMAIAVGVVCFAKDRDMDLAELEKLADKRMYENKAAYYRKNGIDRRR